MSVALPFTDNELETLVVEAVDKFFSTMLSTEVTLKESLEVVVDGGEEEPPAALQTDEPMVASAVGYIGALNGVLYLYFEDSMSKQITAQFLGMEIEEVEAEGHEVINDALGEISNMVVGVFKNNLCDRGYNCRLTIPSILRGQHFAIESTSEIKRIIFRFELLNSIFAVDLLMKMGE